EDVCPQISEYLDGISWMIVGGESGPGFRNMDTDWARRLRDLCAERKLPFFFKQSAAIRTEMGTEIDGVTYHEIPSPYQPEPPAPEPPAPEPSPSPEAAPAPAVPPGHKRRTYFEKLTDPAYRQYIATLPEKIEPEDL